MIFLPGAVQPVIIPEDSRLSGIRGKFELKVINPNGAGFVP